MLKPFFNTGVPIARQKKVLDTIAANPAGSYVFSGPPGAGKTMVMREVERLARESFWKNFAVYSATAMQYQADVTAAARGENVRGLVKPDSLDKGATVGIRWGIFFDDIDKVSGSEFIHKEIFGLLNAVTTQREPPTQLVMTTNMRKDEFAKFFGDAVARRVFQHCLWVSMEREP